MSKFWNAIKRGFAEFENALMPEYSCLVCGRECADTVSLVCDNCKKILIPIAGHVCAKCGNPIPESMLVCDECKNNKDNQYDMARSAYIFDDESSKMIYSLKYYGNKYAAKHIASAMIAPLSDFGQVDIIVPVPLHQKRYKERGYNQAKLLCDSISEMTSLPTSDKLLERKIETETQTGKSKEERKANVVGAFVVTNKAEVKGKNILVVDDVFTTGATTNECARVLKRAGAKHVYVLCCLKTVSALSHVQKTIRKKK